MTSTEEDTICLPWDKGMLHGASWEPANKSGIELGQVVKLQYGYRSTFHKYCIVIKVCILPNLHSVPLSMSSAALRLQFLPTHDAQYIHGSCRSF